MSNVALNKAATASSSIAPYLPARAVDGSTAALNRWMAHGTPVWLAVDLGGVYWINRWVVRMPGVSGWQGNHTMMDFKLQGSLDNSTWFDMDSVVNNSSSSVDRIVAARQVRYARVYVTRGLSVNTSLASIMEFELYDAANAPYLTNLMPVNWTLSPVFEQAVYSYTVNVGSETGNIQITPAAPAGMEIKVNGAVVASGQPSMAITLNTGNNAIQVTVMSVDHSMTVSYNINVVRPGIAQTATLSSLLLFNSRDQGLTFTPSFNKDISGYGITVANGIATVKVAPTATIAGAGITVNGSPVTSGTKSGLISLNVGSNNITIGVSCSGYTTGTYTISVTRAA